MKNYIVIVAWTNENRVAKYQDFNNPIRAAAHVSNHGGFVVAKPGDNPADWLIDPVAKTVSIDALPPTPAPTKEERYNKNGPQRRLALEKVCADQFGMTAAQMKTAIKAKM